MRKLLSLTNGVYYDILFYMATMKRFIICSKCGTQYEATKGCQSCKPEKQSANNKKRSIYQRYGREWKAIRGRELRLSGIPMNEWKNYVVHHEPDYPSLGEDHSLYKLYVLKKSSHALLHGSRNAKPDIDASRFIIVYGPPFAGKSTYINAAIKKGENQVSRDDIISELLGVNTWGIPYEMRQQVEQAFNRRLAMLSGLIVYIPTTTINDVKRFCRKGGAELMEIIPSREECFIRAEIDKQRGWTLARSKRAINEWFEKNGV